MISKLFLYLSGIATVLILVFGVPKLLAYKVSLRAGSGDIFVADTAKALPNKLAQVADTAKALPRENGRTAKIGSNGQTSKSKVNVSYPVVEDATTGDIVPSASPDPMVSISPVPPSPTPWPRVATPEPTPVPNHVVTPPAEVASESDYNPFT